MRVPFPKSLSGQFAIVMASALLSASLISFVLLIAERQRAAMIEQSGPPIARFADLAEVVFGSPAAGLGDFFSLRTQGPGRYQLAKTNPVDRRSLPRNPELEERLSEALADAGVTPTEVRAATRIVDRTSGRSGGPGLPPPFKDALPPPPFAARPQLPRPAPDDPGAADAVEGSPGANTPQLAQRSGDRAERERSGFRMRAQREIVLAAQLSDGRWLTGLTLTPEPANDNVFLLGMSTFVSFVFVLGAALWIAGRLAKPLRDLAHAAQELGTAGSAQEVQVRGPGDIRQTIEAFNAMTRRVNQLLGEKDVMLGAIGHDLRTPLASLRIRLESMEPESERIKAVRTIEEAASLLEDILEFSRQGKSLEPVQKVDVSIIVQDLVEDYAETGAPVSLEHSDKAPGACRPVLLRRALRNLVDNAIAYGKTARVFVLNTGTEIVVRIEDDGPGMSPEALATATNPFYRGEASRSRTTGGAGLGLTLADAIAKAHKGRLILENRPEGGVRATLMLPAAPVPRARV